VRRVCEYLFSVAYYLLCKLLYVRGAALQEKGIIQANNNSERMLDRQ
jgi:hypothetical protein